MKKENKLLTNIIYNALYQILNLIIPLLSLPYISRIFNPEIIGIYSYTLSFVQFFVLLGSFGILNYGSRAIALSKERISRSNNFNEIWLIQIITNSLSFIILLLFIEIIMPYKMYLRLQALLVLVNSFEISWLYIGIEDFKKIALRNIYLKSLVAFFTFLLIKHPNHISVYILINVLSVLVGNLIMFKSLKKYVDFCPIKLTDLKKHIKPAFMLLLPQLITLIYTTLDKTILGTVSNTVQVGFYDQSQKIIRIAISLLTSVTTVLMPRMTSLIDLGKKEEFKNLFLNTLQYTMLISCLIISVIIVIGKDFVVWFYGIEYETVGNLMIFTSIIGFLIPITTLIGYTILIPFRLEKYILLTSTLSAIISILFNFLLDEKFGAKGACIALILAEIVAFIYRGYFARKVISFNILSEKTIKIFISSIVSILIGNLIIQFVEGYFICTIVGAFIVTISYILCLLLLKHGEVMEFGCKFTKIIERRF